MHEIYECTTSNIVLPAHKYGMKYTALLGVYKSCDAKQYIAVYCEALDALM